MRKKCLSRLLSLMLSAALLLGGLPWAHGAGAELTVTLSPDALSLRMGDTVTAELTATVKLGGGDPPDGVGYTWESGDTGVVTVSGDGSPRAAVTAVGPGTTTVTLEVAVGDRRKTAVCTVIVLSPALDELRIYEGSDMVLEVGEERTMTAVPYPGGADLSDLRWTSAKPDVVSVTPGRDGTSAVVRGAAPGDEVAVTAAAGGKEAVCRVSVKGLVLDRDTLSLTTGRSETLTARSTGGSSSHVTWSSGNESVAMVNPSTGAVTGQGQGTTQITAASADGYTAVCEVTVTENTAGVITDSAGGGRPLSFSELEDRMDRACRETLDAPLSYVTNLSVPTDQGILFYGYVSADDTGAGVGSLEKYYYDASGRGTRRLSDVTFVAKGDFSGDAVVSYTGYSSAGRFFNGTIRVEVEESADVVYSTGRKTPVTFRASDFSAVCRSQNGRDMSFVRFTLPASRYGSLSFNYVSPSQPGSPMEEGTQYYRSRSPSLDNVSFVPALDGGGTVRIPYSGEDTAGNRFSGRVTVYVSGGGSGGGGSGDIRYSTGRGERVSLRTSDFNALCREATGEAMDYVRFDPPAAGEGALYYDYSGSGSYDFKAGSSDRFYRSGSPYLSRVTFVPKSGFSGTVELDFNGYSDGGDRFSGTVEIAVGGGGGGGALSYRTEEGEPVEFTVGDFNDLCKDELDETLDYVRFDLPPSGEGTLYYDDTGSGGYGSRVSSSDRYYRGRSPYLSRITFVPKSGFTGTAEVDFTAYGAGGGRFTGTVEIAVGEGGGAGRVAYASRAGRAVSFSAGDFNDLCRDLQGVGLDYVRFDLPSAGEGTLYYNYTSGGGHDGRVSASTGYYRSGGSRQLSKVSFVPASGFDGRVDVDFTGYDVDGGRFHGVVEITVDGAAARLYESVKSFDTLPLDAAGFNELCKEVTGRALSYVKLTPPPSGQGTLYYDYDGEKGTGGKVSSSTAYYRTGGSRQLDRVRFVPAAGFTGTAEIPFTGWSTDGEKFTGTLAVEVTATVARALRYAAKGEAVTLRSEDFAGVCREVTGGELDYVRLTQPGGGAGRLLFGGAGSGGEQTRPSANYYRRGEPALDRVVFVPEPGYEGAVTVAYTGVDTAGRSYSGALEFAVTAGEAPVSFRDMADYGWAAASVEYLSRTGVVKGVGDAEFGPERLVTRGDFVLMLCRAFSLEAEGAEGFPDVPAESYYAGAVATARELGIARGAGDGRFYPLGPVTRQDAALFLLNAMRSAGWSISDGAAGGLSGYPDAAAVSDYAVGAVSAMVKLGVLRGTGAGRLAPEQTLTRAELAVLLHRALTL